MRQGCLLPQKGVSQLVLSVTVLREHNGARALFRRDTDNNPKS